ncbi:MAG: hypothetical protein C0434_06990 [Xanthomonadaceae bacterium]|nr:hypothetical protein [Xanthomonadaceae bacterium]
MTVFLSLEIAPPQVVVVAGGDTSAAQANARGHLFEKFMARTFEAYGCQTPSSSSVNVRQNGYEVDITTQFVLSKESAVAECKAYSAPVAIPALTGFYGKLSAQRLDDPVVHGWFVAIPGLTADGNQLARKLEEKDRRFRLITASQIFELALSRDWISDIPSGDDYTISDKAILLTPTGVFSMVKVLDAATRLPSMILVRGKNFALSSNDLPLLLATDYAAGLPIRDISEQARQSIISSQPAETPTLVTVKGSQEDFEYQLPAAPHFFVGRDNVIARIKREIEESKNAGHVVVLNAQSGWGKSSLALRIAYETESTGGTAAVFDTRTASTPTYVAAALQRAATKAVDAGQLELSADASFASLHSALRSLQVADWTQGSSLTIFFDQFENVFRDTKLTQEFRDLALSVRELTVPVLIGFAWKTDLVSLTESYPYRLRDEIRSVALVIAVDPFGPRDVGTLLARLAKAAEVPISNDLKQRLREYSQGLPWLLKKLASHILNELRAGTSEETLLSESLNIDSLFEQDLVSLEAAEIDAIKAVAREAPVLVSDIVEKVSPSIIQSLVDRRLVVRVGERIDVYWDTFREFLLTGKVAVEDTYILRVRPASTTKLLQYLVGRTSEVATAEAAADLSMSLHVVFNAARELRQLGVLAPKSGALLLAEQFRFVPPTEQSIRDRVSRSLKRHKVYKHIVHSVLGRSPTDISIDVLALELPPLFPALEATSSTWRTYALAFASWLDYCGLMRLRGQVLCAPEGGASKVTLLGTEERGRRAKTFPHSRPETAFAYLRHMVNLDGQKFTESVRQKAETDLQVLGVLDGRGEVVQSVALALLDPNSFHSTLKTLLRAVPGGAGALTMLELNRGAHPVDIGSILREAFGLPWAPSTTHLAGTKFRSWASFAGVSLQKVSRRTIGG